MSTDEQTTSVPDRETALTVHEYVQALDAAKRRWEYLVSTGQPVPPELSAIVTAGQPVDAVTVLSFRLMDELTGHHVGTRYATVDGRDIDPADWVLETIDEATEPAVLITVAQTSILPAPAG